MKKLLTIFKELFEYLLREIPSFFQPVVLEKKQYNGFKKNGYIILDKKLDSVICDKIISSFEKCISDNNTWVDDTKSDTRLFYAQKYIKEIDCILNNNLYNSISRKFYGKKINQKFSLMNKVVPTENNLGSGAGWHRDSPTSHQLKVLIYLSDVEKGNGQFQYIENSFKKFDIFKTVLRYKWTDKYRFSENEISKYIKDFKTKIVDITGEKGTIVIVDTKGIHRGAPIEFGKRYAMFNYYYKDKIPDHFKKFQNLNAN
jgi:hypothetical protein